MQVVDNTVIESNKKLVNEIYLNCELNDTVPDSTQLIQLHDIAMQFPTSSGDAVYMARAMLHMHVEDQLPPLRRKHYKAGTLIKPFGLMYPNPGNDHVSYQLFERPDKYITIVFEDVTGRIALKGMDKNVQMININTSILVSGTYFYHIYEGEIEMDRGKLIISH